MNNPCENDKKFILFYVIAIITLFTIGGLYEADVLPKKQESDYKYGLIGLVIFGLLLVFMNYVFKYIKPSKQMRTYFWYFSHILCYFTVTLVSPAQWPFWLAIGITWELFECYYSCGLVKKGFPIGCNGMYDITANIAGIAIAMWIRSEIDRTD
jgi:hypothetical protein